MSIGHDAILKYAIAYWDVSRTEEAYLRSIINRWYQGTYLFVKTETNAPISNSSTSHQELIDFCSTVPELNKVGNNLRYLRSLRNKADYRIDQTIDASDARGAKRSAVRTAKSLDPAFN